MVKLNAQYLLGDTNTKTSRTFDKIPWDRFTAPEARGFINKYKYLVQNATVVKGSYTVYTETEVDFE